MALHERGVLERYGVELIGADIEAIQRGEDRLKFKEIVQSIGARRAALARSATRWPRCAPRSPSWGCRW